MNEFMEKIELKKRSIYFIAMCFCIFTVPLGLCWALSNIIAWLATGNSNHKINTTFYYKQILFAPFCFVKRKILK